MEFDLGSSGLAKVDFKLLATECYEILSGLKQLYKESFNDEYEIFNRDFYKSLPHSAFIRTCNYFQELSISDHSLKSLVEKLDNESAETDSLIFEQNSTDIASLFDTSIETTEVNFTLEIQMLSIALRVLEFYAYQNRIKNNEAINEPDDWVPPESFKLGTDGEKEIWESFIKVTK